MSPRCSPVKAAALNPRLCLSGNISVYSCCFVYFYERLSIGFSLQTCWDELVRLRVTEDSFQSPEVVFHAVLSECVLFFVLFFFPCLCHMDYIT